MRSRPTALLLLCLLVAFWWLTPSSATTAALRINETATRVWPREGKTEVALAIENLTTRPLRVKVELEWVDPNDIVDGKTERLETVSPGAGKLTIPFPMPKEIHAQDKTLWYRLRYRLAPENDKAFAPVSGIVSLSEITPDIFELRVTSSEFPIPGKQYRAHIRALHPLTARPIGGVSVTANLKFDNDRKDSFKATGLTNAKGYVALDFNLPRDLVAEDGKVEIKAARGEFKQEAEFETRDDFRMTNRLILTTDKPIYQPGQTLHIRSLLFDFINRAIANANLELEINDPEGTQQFRADLKTSRFGVANIDWQIPDNVRLGEYRISIDLDDDKHGQAQMELRVKISRYDLPNFAVKTKPDREFYLPGQNAEVAISADYLFGQPVTKGKVRVVREGRERWDSQQRKYVREQAESFEGEVGAAGRFVAKIDLTEAHKDFSDDSYRRFEDRTYAAYFTDATTGRTEQKRFDLRVTREPIHLYVIGLEDRVNENLPLQFYVSASYADGKPAECEVTINELIESDDADEPVEQQLRKVKTNARGLAKVSGLSLPKRDDRGRLELSLTAHDGKDRVGRRKENIWLSDGLAVNLETDKAIYRPSDPIEVQIKASSENALAILSISREMEVVHSQAVKLRGGKAFVVIPYRPEFSGEVGVAVTVEAADEDGKYRSAESSRAVVYPRDRELKLDVRMSSAEYRPGDDGRASFRVTTAEGRPLESVLGVTVVDRAVEERARTDSEFNGRSHYDFSGYYLNTGSGLAGVTLRDLRKLDTAQPISAQTQLIAEILLLESGYQPRVETSGEYDRDPKQVFRVWLGRQFMPVSSALEKHFYKTGEYPNSRAKLDEILNIAELDFAAMRDPWGVPYQTKFSTQREFDSFHAVSAGADKKFDMADDFTAFTADWPYFTKTGTQIRQAMKQFNELDGRVTLDAAVFKEELKRNGLDFDALRDRWGKPYLLTLSVAGTRWLAHVHSGGEDGKFAPPPGYSSDDFVVWVSEWTYFERTANRLDGLLANHLKTTGEYPSDETEFRSSLKASGVEFDSLRDPWGNGFYVTFTNTFSYGDRVVVRYDELQKKKTELQPVTRQISIISLRSRGADGMEKTSDDFTVAEFSRLTVEMSSHDQQPKPPDNAAMFSNMLGEIRGIVTDVQGAAIAGASLKLTRALTQLERQTTSDSSGNYQFRNLPQGTYKLECETPGFRKLVITDIRVLPATVTQVTATPDVGAVSEVVAVSASVPQFQTTQDASVATVMSSKQIANLPINARNAANLLALSPGTQAGKSELATPRLREHFQETLVWQPQLETDKQGRASLKFKMADNITTWKLAAVASTVDGQIGIAETEFKAFQPFFAEHDPPKVLTEGDEISLPVVLRNYLGKSLSVTTEMKPERWFTLLGTARQQTRVAAGDSANAVFDFRVTGSVANGKQRVTALSTAASDAIEKPVSVHPDGEELAQTVGGVFANDGKLNLTIPADAIKTSVRAELKIYPNLMAHALEGIEGILRRPYGCGEQTISSTYPNVMALRYLRQQDESAAALAAKARRYAQAGYERLLGYRAESGGFSYWGRGEADLALTAYAVRFLNDARDYVSVEDSTIAKARDWVIAQQQTDGRWKSQWYVSDEDFRRSSLTTAYVAGVLAAEQKRLTKPDKKLSESLQRALTYLAARVEEIDEPYLIASFALAAFDAGQTSTATKAVARLRQLARNEAGTAYWNLESNTPFYGWGLAGRVETTALVVKALQRDRETAGRRDGGTERDALTDKGLLFLLRNKDRYGVWYSTQATINVLDAMISLYEAERVKTSAGGQAEILVNGKPAGSVVIPPGEKLGNPLIVNLASAIGVGDNRVEIRRSGEVTLATAQIVETHYAAWKDPAKEIIEPNKSSLLRLAVSYDKPQAKIGEEIICNVAAERIGHSGYGMLLGEIGLPPGADVDRASLELAMKNSGWELNQYDVLPDRIVVYLWPRAGGTKFSFKFKLRYGIRAQSAPSVLYDYYNPEARVVVAPTRFAVK